MNLTVKRLKSLFAVFLAVMMMASILPVSSFAVDNFDGYTPISTAEELANIKNDMNGKYYLTQDIALTGTWTPLGLGSSGEYDAFDGTAFKGILDGNGHKITGMTVDCETYAGVGLFAASGSGAEIRNLTIEGADVYGRYWTGALAGINNGIIENCHVVNSTVAGHETGAGNYIGGSQIGGISGWNQMNGDITGCSVMTTSVLGNRYVGGIVGVNNGLIEKTFVRDCSGKEEGIWIGSKYYKNNSSASTALLAVAQYLLNGSGTNTPYMYVGGIAGANQTNNGTGTVKNCYVVNTQLNSIDAMAELIGVNWGVVENCYTAENGLAYYSSYNTGSYTLTPDYIARNIYNAGGSVTGVHYYNSSSLRLSGAGTEHLNGANMKDQSIYTGWDFSNIWTLDASETAGNYGYPVFGVTPPAPDPEAPEEGDIPGIISGSDVIRVECINAGTTHSAIDYAILDGSYTVGTVKKDGTSYTVDITVDSTPYVTEYNKTYSGHTYDSSVPSPAVITLEWSGTAWTLPASLTKPYITFKVTHDEPVVPDKPEVPDIPGIITGNDAIRVECINPVSPHDGVDYAILTGSYTVGEVENDGTSYTVDITIDSAPYVTEYNKTYSGHTYRSSVPDPAVITLEWNGTAWTVPASLTKPYVTFKVMHDETPVVPEAPEDKDIPDILTGDDIIRIECMNASEAHASKDYGIIPGTYTIGGINTSPMMRAAVYTVDITIDGTQYVAAYNAENGEHALNGSAPDPAVITLIWDGTDWTLPANLTKPYVTFNVTHEDKDFTITKNADKEYASVGDTINYTIELKNTGNTALTGIVVEDEMFKSENCGKILVNGAEIVPVNGKISVDLPADGSTVITYAYTVPESAKGTILTNNAVAEYGTNEINVQAKNSVIILPDVPSNDIVSKLFGDRITVACLRDAHDDKTYGIVDNGYTAGAITVDKASGITCEIAINDTLYVDMYSKDIGTKHASDEINKKAVVTLSYDPETAEWKLPDDFSGIMLSAVCSSETNNGGTNENNNPDMGDNMPVILAAAVLSLTVLVFAFAEKKRRSRIG